MNAGIRSPGASRAFFALKSLLAVLLPLAFVPVRLAWLPSLGLHQTVFAAALLSAAGYCLPNYLLSRRIEARRRQIVENFPDALDLLTISVEAGLGLDAGLYRVASELSLNSPALADELTLVSLELRAGMGRERALRNLATRTGVADIETLVALIIQSDRFGTGVSDALRVHSEQLRGKRRQRAEQEAAKLSNRLLFPLMLCIFPAILIVVAAPAAIQISKTLPSIGAKAR
jgi:tight adherence protein C